MKKLCLSVLLLLALLGAGYAPPADARPAPQTPAASLTSGMAEEALPGASAVQGMPDVYAEAVPEGAGSLDRPAVAASKDGQDAKAGEEATEEAEPADARNASEGEGTKTPEASEEGEGEYVPEEEEAPAPTIADPLEPFNRAMYHFNDKLYFWLLKPVGEAYGKVVPEPARISVRNFFSNLAFPFRFLSCVLQADLRCAGTETGRFAVNTVLGIGGLLDPASGPELNLQKQDVDLGQTLGVYGAGPGFYFVWPVFGPSSLRDSVNVLGGYFLNPVSYLNPWYTPPAVRTYEAVNETSLSIGDYEALKGAAIDPYLSIRDAYVQSRTKKIEARKRKPEAPQAGDAQQPPPAKD